MKCKMKTHYLSIVACTFVVISSLNGNTDVNILRRRLPKRSRYNYFVRCTRRFTPGLCIEPVRSVWTFVFQLQNCTERYGCRQDWRTNRFTTYDKCLRRCQPLIDLYTEILVRDPRNLSVYSSQSWNKSGRRDSGDEEDSTDLQDEEYDHKIEGNLNGPAPNLLDDSVDHNDWAVTVDIDDVVESIENDGSVYHDVFHD
ncbi:uncharacterized protein LOC123877445 [Maniola jurtina]|uniref:uncharacterized protein LOC123877445 n=1 Tax=Maniola jurtina TaxID=191418 RepID=UPI001E68693D|nr:uncharacterized protein LOC123877445 [Maniola jurtina]